MTEFRIITSKYLRLGDRATIQGWIHRVRNHGGLLFVDIRDYDGVVQCALDASNPNIADLARVREESCVEVSGVIRKRPAGTENPKLFTGTIEMVVESFMVHNHAAVLPFVLHDEEFNASDEARLKYRYLDLRRPKMQRNLMLRSSVIASLREFMWYEGFMEIQTPILTASSPEGARDYLVPARLHPGKFYALPQAPQIFKQILMCSGVRRYFQIAPCFRDEAGRSDRSPGEFYQLDIEMAFADQTEVFRIVGDVITRLFQKYTDPDCFERGGFYLSEKDVPTYGWSINEYWNIIPYEESMRKYGNDKPDLRVADHCYIHDITVVVRPHAPAFLQEVMDANGVVLAIPVYAPEGKLTGKWFKDLDSFARDLGMPGLGYFKVSGGNVSGPMAKFFEPLQITQIINAFDMPDMDDMDGMDASYLIIAGQQKEAYQWASKLRVEAAKRSGNYDEKSFEFCWIVDFPMYERNEETGKIEFSHNPFSMPQGGMEALETQDPLTIKAFQYDLVCNGLELSSGAIRNHRIDIMEKAFEIAGYDSSVVKEKFTSLYNAMSYGMPPSGGIAPGIERILMILANEPQLREVIPFPMTNSAQDLMMGSPSEVTPEQLKEIHIKIDRR